MAVLPRAFGLLVGRGAVELLRIQVSANMPIRFLQSLNWLATAGLMALLLSACGDQRDWRSETLASGFPRLQFELLTADDQRISEAVMQGKVTLLFFGYLSCPDVCPTTMATLHAALESLPADQREGVRILFVSVDPKRDDPERLAAYANWFGPQFIAATAGPDDLRQLTSRYGSSFEIHDSDGRPNYLVTHGSHVLAFDRQGRARLLIRHDDGSDAIAHDLRRLLAS